VKYIKNGIKYRLIDTITHPDSPHDIIADYDEIAVVFDIKTGTLLKHGDFHKVNEWYNTAIKKYEEANLQGMIDDMMIISGQIDPDKINKCINHSGTSHRVFAEEIKLGKQINDGTKQTEVVQDQEDQRTNDN